MVHYGINHAGVQVTQWDIRNKETSTRPARRSFFFKVPLCYQHPSMANDVPCMHVTGQIMQRAYFYVFLIIFNKLQEILRRLEDEGTRTLFTDSKSQYHHSIKKASLLK